MDTPPQKTVQIPLKWFVSGIVGAVAILGAMGVVWDRPAFVRQDVVPVKQVVDELYASKLSNDLLIARAQCEQLQRTRPANDPDRRFWCNRVLELERELRRQQGG